VTRAPRNRYQHPAITVKPAMTIKVCVRLIAVAAYLLFGVLLAFVIGMFFVRFTVWQRPVIAWWLRGFCRVLNMQVTVQGAPIEDSALWISNHVSWMDIPVIGGIRPLRFLSKAEVAQWPVIGRLAQAAGTLFIKRGSGDADRVSEEMVLSLQQGKRVLFFPEGTTTDGFSVNRFFAKLFTAATKSQCLIQPLVICYQTADGQLHAMAPFIGDDELAPHLLNMLAGEPVHVRVHCLPAEVAGDRDASALARHFEQLMGQTLRDLHGAEQPPSRGDHPATKAA